MIQRPHHGSTRRDPEHQSSRGWTTLGKSQGTLCKDNPAQRVQEHLLRGDKEKMCSDRLGPGLLSWRSGSSRSSVCKRDRESWTGEDTVHTYTIHTHRVEVLTPTLNISSTIFALYTFSMNDKNTQDASILFFPED